MPFKAETIKLPLFVAGTFFPFFTFVVENVSDAKPSSFLLIVSALLVVVAGGGAKVVVELDDENFSTPSSPGSVVLAVMAAAVVVVDAATVVAAVVRSAELNTDLVGILVYLIPEFVQDEEINVGFLTGLHNAP